MRRPCKGCGIFLANVDDTFYEDLCSQCLSERVNDIVWADPDSTTLAAGQDDFERTALGWTRDGDQ